MRLFRNISIVALVAAVMLSCGNPTNAAQKRQDPDISAVIDAHRSTEGVNVISIGKVGLGLLGMIARTQVNDSKAMAVLKSLGGVDKVVVVEWGSCAKDDIEKMDEDFSTALSGKELVLEARDGNDVVRIYGVVDDEGMLSDCIIYCPGESALVCATGTIDLSSIMALAQDEKIAV